MGRDLSTYLVFFLHKMPTLVYFQHFLAFLFGSLTSCHPKSDPRLIGRPISGNLRMHYSQGVYREEHGEHFKFLFLPKKGLLGSQAKTGKKIQL